MRIQFCGADRTVTGSCHLVEVNGLRIFLDAGLYQGPREEANRLNHFLPDDIKSADAIILSHGHLDHCGKLPVFTRAGFTGPIYCTPATAEVARVIMMDAAKIQEEDVDYLNRRTRDPDQEKIEPLYRSSDVPAVLQQFKRVQYGQKVDLGGGVSFTFYDAGHILGSAYVVLQWNEGGKDRSLLFTADVGRYNTPIIRDPQTLSGPFDQVITESTYGNSLHGPMEEVEPELLDAVNQCIRGRGRLLIPSFAMGRTQTILWYMQKFISEKKIPPIPIFVDSPMGAELTRIHGEFRENYDEQTRAMIGEKDLFGLSRVTLAASSQDSIKINSQAGPCVIIASSPTCEFGRILHHLKVSLERPNDMVLFVGWVPPQTLGRRLQESQSRVRVFDQWYDVKCQVKTIHGLSAHADSDELLRFLQPTTGPQTTAFVVHGEEAQAETLARRLVAKGMGRVVVPAMESSEVCFYAKDEPLTAGSRGGAADAGVKKTDND
ncbi:MAG TPA: MBL fold metallo-hydrolase [Tepidisphaeraceae bacterium]|jgi:metallo-beta-lactamase family protein